VVVTRARSGLVGMILLLGVASCRLGSFTPDCVGQCGGAGPLDVSPTECRACSTDADCHSASEVCLKGPVDGVPACHSDCSSDAACPADYTCGAVDVDGTERQLCVPDAGSCDDAIGGSCEPTAPPMRCERSNDWGACQGHRYCLEPSQRFGTCDAEVPQCRATCEQRDLPGCTTSLCASALQQPGHCGACDNACPGLGHAETTEVTCDGKSCGMRCLDSSYDVNDDPSDGCETIDPIPGNHTRAAALDLGGLPCEDETGNLLVSGSMASDARQHSRASVVDPATGAAPDWYRIRSGSRFFCDADLALTLTLTESSNPTCYRLTVFTSAHVDGLTCETDRNGTCSIADPAPAYGSNSDVLVVVEKACPSDVREAPSYTIAGHL
jgi:hypothetical protein